MKIGYARVSTNDQNLESQIIALNQEGCEKIYQEKESAIKNRPKLEELIAQLREGDVVVVTKLDRLGRSLRHLVNLINDFNEKVIEFKSIKDNIDTTTAQGRLMFNIIASFAEFEREMISERTKAGLTAARARGRTGGRPAGLSKKSQQKAIYALHLHRTQPDKTAREIQKELGLKKATFYRYLNWAKEQEEQSAS